MLRPEYALDPGYLNSLLNSEPPPETCCVCGNPVSEGTGLKEDIYNSHEEVDGYCLYHLDCYGIVWEDCHGD